MLLVDQTGVGRAIIDMLHAAKVRAMIRPLTITAGLTATHDQHGGLLVPKKDLVATMQAVLQTRRMQIAESLLEADTLVNELQNFKAKPAPASGSADPIAAWREGADGKGRPVQNRCHSQNGPIASTTIDGRTVRAI